MIIEYRDSELRAGMIFESWITPRASEALSLHRTEALARKAGDKSENSDQLVVRFVTGLGDRDNGI